MARKILIVDDSRSARYFIRSCLPKEDVEIREAENGKVALDLFPDFQPDVTLLDLTMPEMDGFEALRRIRDVDPRAIVIVLTADVQKKTTDRIMDLGAQTFLKKPPRKDTIGHALDRAFEELDRP